MKPFDLERAKAGDAIYDTVTGVEFYFVGTRYTGEIVIEVYGAQTVACRNQDELRMMPKKRTVWVNLYLPASDQKSGRSCHYESEADAEWGACGFTRIGGKAYPVEIEE